MSMHHSGEMRREKESACLLPRMPVTPHALVVAASRLPRERPIPTRQRQICCQRIHHNKWVRVYGLR